MQEIKWVQASDTIREAFEGDVRIGKVEFWNTDWYWRMLDGDLSGPLATSGQEDLEHDARKALENCRSDQVALSGRGPLRWAMPRKDDWMAFSGNLQVGNVALVGDEIRVIRRWHSEDLPAKDVREGRRMVDDWWRDLLKVAALVPEHLAGKSQQN